MTDQSDVDDTLGGESSCYAHLLCLDCGVVLDGSAHRPGCARADGPDDTAGHSPDCGPVTGGA